jgi:hypothetical protein
MTDASGRADTATEGNVVAWTVIKGGAGCEVGSLRRAENASKKTGGSIIAFGSVAMVAGRHEERQHDLGQDGRQDLPDTPRHWRNRGQLSVGTITDATSFVINPDSNTETSTVAWLIVR